MNQVGQNGQHVLRDSLHEHGLSDADIGALDQSTATSLYLAELRTLSPDTIISNIFLPALIGSVLALNNQQIFGLLTTAIGWLSLPIGKRAYQQSDLQRVFSRRLADSAGATEYQHELMLDHILMVFKLAVIGEIPNILSASLLFAKALNYISELQQVFSGYVGITAGLTSLANSLIRQRNIVSDGITKELVETVFKTVSSGDWILTNQKWLKHTEAFEQPPAKVNIENGLIVQNITSIGMAEPISFQVKKGHTVLLRSPSGTGKSVGMSAIAQYIEHKGFVGVVENGVITSLHDFSLEQVRNMFQLEFGNGMQNVSILEYLQEVFLTSDDFQEFVHKHGFGALSPKKIEAVLHGKDVHLKQIIEKKIWTNAELNTLEKFYESRRLFITQLFNEWNLFPENPQIDVDFRSQKLSDGQKQRLVNLRSLITAASEHKLVVMLDEPFGRMDSKTAMVWINKVKDFVERHNLVLIITSHQYVEEDQISSLERDNAINDIFGDTLITLDISSNSKN